MAQSPNTDQDLRAQQASVDQAQQALSKAQSPNTSYDIEQQRQAVIQAEANLHAKQNPYTDDDVKQAQGNLSQAQAGLASAMLSLSDTKVTAPVDGVVSEKLAAPGAFVSQSASILTLVPPGINVTASLPEQQLGTVQVGQTVNFTVSAYPGKTFQGTVSTISPTINPQTRTVQLQIQPTNDQGQLRGGMLANLGIVTASDQDVLTVPRSALLNSGAASQGQPSSVWVIDASNSVRATPVTLGLVNDTPRRSDVGSRRGRARGDRQHHHLDRRPGRRPAGAGHHRASRALMPGRGRLSWLVLSTALIVGLAGPPVPAAAQSTPTPTPLPSLTPLPTQTAVPSATPTLAPAAPTPTEVPLNLPTLAIPTPFPTPVTVQPFPTFALSPVATQTPPLVPLPAGVTPVGSPTLAPIPPSGGQLAAADGSLTVQAVPDPSRPPLTLVYQGVDARTLPPGQGTLSLGFAAYQLSAVNSDTHELVPSLNVPLDLVINPGQSDLALALGQLQRLYVGMWNGSSWVAVPCGAGAAPGHVCVLDHPARPVRATGGTAHQPGHDAARLQHRRRTLLYARQWLRCTGTQCRRQAPVVVLPVLDDNDGLSLPPDICVLVALYKAPITVVPWRLTNMSTSAASSRITVKATIPPVMARLIGIAAPLFGRGHRTAHELAHRTTRNLVWARGTRSQPISRRRIPSKPL